ncbi:MAG: hypothetical protein QOK37_248 [Thermoanaerobaculia bacterium]|jgi:hypothetical protein|nr:hypothetical protein [Thermoanaerobaculia bacterium]
MRNVRNAPPSSHSFVITVIALLFLTASPMLAAAHPKVTVQKAAEPVRNEYLIMLDVPSADVPKVATELTKRYGGEVLAVWQHAVKGFWLKAEPEVARHMVQDRRIKSCEENAVGHDSGVPQLTKVKDDGISLVTPSPEGVYPPLGTPNHPLWHLNRISHRQRQDGLTNADYKYTYGSDGSWCPDGTTTCSADMRKRVAIYLIDGGVLRWHQEFYENPGPGEPPVTKASINQDATDKINRSPRVRKDAAANMVDGRLPPTYIADNSLGKDPINNGDPIAPVGDCGAPTVYNFPPPNGVPYEGQTHGTACASVAAGRNVGVAKGAAIVPVKVFNCAFTDSLGAVISGLDWTLSDIRRIQYDNELGHQPDYRAVVSMSIFFSARVDGVLIKADNTHNPSRPEVTTTTAVGQPLGILSETIAALTDYGVPVVVSANNQDADACNTVPAKLSIRAGGRVITVGGLSKGSDSRWSDPAGVFSGDSAARNPGSNFGRCVDLWAPAESIELATMKPESPNSDGIAYRASDASGTSFSAPIVAGMIARLMSENPTLVGRNPAAVQKTYNLLTSSATRLPDDIWSVGGFGADSPNLIAYIGGLQITRQPGYYGTGAPQLSVVVLTKPGDTPTYEWREGARNDASKPVISTEPILPSNLALLGNSYWVRVTGKCYDGTGDCTADSTAVKIANNCSLDVRAQADFLTRVIPSGDAPITGQKAQIIDAEGALITARVSGVGPYTCSVTAVVGPAPIDNCVALLETPNTAPDGRPQWIIGHRNAISSQLEPGVHVKPTDASQYTVTFTNSDPLLNIHECGSTTVSVSVCAQPKIALLPVLTHSTPTAPYLWKTSSDSFGLNPDTTRTTVSEPDANGVPSNTAFQWFFGGYDNPVPLAGGRSLNPVPFFEGQYWARVDGRCGWAATLIVNVLSCYMYNSSSLMVAQAPAATPGPNGERRVDLIAKLVLANPPINSNANIYTWTDTTGTLITDFSTRTVTPSTSPGTSVTYTVTAANRRTDPNIPGDQPECSSLPKTYTLTTSQCSLIDGDLTQGPLIQTPFGNAANLTVKLKGNVVPIFFEWFTEPAAWTWSDGLVNKGPNYAQGLKAGTYAPTDRPSFDAPIGHSYFVRVHARCPNGTITTEDSNFASLAGRGRAVNPTYKPPHIKSVLGTYYEFATGETSVILSVPELLPNATYKWYSSESYKVPGDPVGTGTDLTIDRATDVEPAAHHARTYWVSTTNAAGGIEDSAMVRLVAVPAVTVIAYPGTVIGTESVVALTAKPPNTPDGTTYPVGTTHQWRQATANRDAEGNEDGTFTKDTSSPVLNSNPGDGTIWRGPIDGQAAFWVHVIEPNGATADSDLVLIIVNCDPLPPSLTVSLDRFDHHVPKDVPVIFSAGSVGRNLTYQWYNIPPGPGGVSQPTGSGGGALWTLSPDGTYRVVATDDCGRTAEASTTVYLCTPTIPDNVSPPDIWIKSGEWAHLSVTATPAKPGDALRYQWYPGNLNLPALPDKTNPTLDVNYTGSFLATVTSDCNDGNHSDVVSAIRTVRVCTDPPINGLSLSHETRLGTTEALQVTATGDALTYQWYQGASGNLANPIAQGTTAAIYVQPSVDSDYWVRVTDHGACWTNSDVIHLTVCAPPAINTQPAGSSVFSGASVTLTVAATANSQAPLHYAWIEVDADGNLVPVAGNDHDLPSFTTPSITASRTWFVRVFSGSLLTAYTDSARATVQLCAMPAVVWASSPQPVGVGAPFTLQINATPAGSKTYWYRGVSGDVAHSTLLSGPIDATYTQVIPDAPSTSYWVRVQKDSCYSDSTTFTVNVCVPAITQQPAGGSIVAGGSLALSVVANTSPLTYHWYKGASGDTSQPATGAGATTATYTASPTADTLYWVRVTGSCGVSADSNAVQVSVCYPPAITSNSPAQWYILGGASTTVSVNATGSNLTYQWYSGTSGNTASPLSAATSSITVTPQNTSSYWVRVSGSCGTPQNSVTMTVNVCGSPAITAQPQGSTINSGSTATMSIAATESTTTAMTYQWYSGISGNVSAPIANATGTIFTTPALSTTTSYWVRVSCGVCTPADSQTATISVCNNAQPLAPPADQFIAIGQTATLSTPPASGNVYQWYVGASGNTSQPAPGASTGSSYSAAPSVTTQYWVQIQNGGCTFRTQSGTVNVCVPTITQQPASIMINPGASTTLSVAANTSGLTYQWYAGNSGTTTSPISGATASSVTVSPTTATNYWVRVTGSCTQSVNSTTASVTICAPPVINGASPTQSIIRNNSTSCFVTAAGTNLTYQWYVGTTGITTTPISGATAASVSVTPQNTTNYWVRVTGTCGTINSATMLVNVCASPAITAQPQGTIIFSGGTATMSVTATEGTTTPMTYQWYRGASGDVSAPVGTNSTSFTTPALTAQTNYWVRVSCGVCNPADSQAATISICYYPQNLSSPGDFYTTVGQTVRLYAPNAAGNTYQWYTGATGDTSHPYSSPYSPNMYYADVLPTVTTQYWAQITNGGCISRTAAANVYVCVPTFTQQPVSVTIPPGSSTTLSASANTAGVTYQWYVGASGNTASPIGGATGPSVTVTPGSNASYWARAISSCGRTTDSATATVTLCSPPVITAQPMASTVGGGGATASMWVSATGSNLTYQWYIGNSGDTSNPISGATASNSSMWISATQKVWVRITGSCGAVDSNATFASVYPSIYQQPPSSLVVGYDTTGSISLSASGSYLSYVWKNSQTGAVIATTTTPTLITPSITTNTYIYCQVMSGNASVNANETALTVCYNQPNVTLVNAPNGACRMLYTTTNSADDYQWYQGARGDTSHLLGSGSTSMTVCPTASTQYWVRAIVWSSYQVVSCYTDSNAVTSP